MASLTLADLQRELRQFAADTLPSAVERVVSKEALIRRHADLVVQHVDQHLQRFNLVPSASGFASSPLAACPNVQTSRFATSPLSPDTSREDPLGLASSKKNAGCTASDMGNQAADITPSNPIGNPSRATGSNAFSETTIDGGFQMLYEDSVSPSYQFENPSEGSGSRGLHQWYSHHPAMYAAGEHIQAVKSNKREQSIVQSSPLIATTLALCTCVTGSIENFVKSGTIDYLSAGFILLNAVSLGVQTDYLATNATHKVPHGLRVIEIFFCVIFTTELVLRFIVYRIRFLYMPGWKWNVFDIFVIGLQVMEEIMGLLADTIEATPSDSNASQFKIMRVLRVLRIVRVIRLARILHLIGDLQTLIASILSSVGSLKWTFLLLLLLIYILGIYITQAVLDYRLEELAKDGAESGFSTLEPYFGSLGSSVMTLYQAISGGVDWENVSAPLIDYISPWMGILLSAYIGFAVLALFNIATGVFVERAQTSARQEREDMLLKNVGQLFERTDVDGNGRISLAEFKSKCESADMQVYFKHIGLAIEESEGLFALIDIHGNGTISPDDFINGCLRLSGTARSFDLAIMMHSQKQMAMLLSKAVRQFDKLDSVLSLLHGRGISVPSIRVGGSERRIQGQAFNPNLQKTSVRIADPGLLKLPGNVVQPSRSSVGEHQKPNVEKPMG